MNHSLLKNNVVFLAIVLVAGTISTMIPTSFAQSYYEQEYYLEDPYAKEPYAKDHKKKAADVNIQKIKCINDNVNVNGIEITEVPDSQAPENGIAGAEAQALQNGLSDPNGNGLLSGNGINFDKNLVNVCVNVNVNEQVDENGLTCEECFTQNLDPEEQNELLTEISLETQGSITTFEQLCQAIFLLVENGDEEELQELSDGLASLFDLAGLSPQQFNTVLDCLNQVFNGALPQPQPPASP